jgi:membrane associated rhomboid family serine protease
VATYGLLLAFLIVLILEFIVFYALGEDAFRDIFTIYAIDSRIDWINRPWSPLTATISHDVGNVGHILFNGFTLYFFGPLIERSLGVRRYLTFFAIAGIVSSILQAMIVPSPALGASGAIMGLIAIAIILAPKSQIFFFPFPTPIPLWVAGIIFALLDLMGAFTGGTGIGNVAHLGGMAIGLLYGLWLRRRIVQPKQGYVAPGQ